MKLTISATVERLDIDAYKAAIREAVRATFIRAAQKFLIEAVPRVPEWSGMARGAFRNLEDVAGRVYIGSRRTTIRGNRLGSTKNNPGLKRGYTYEGRERTPDRGRQYSTAPGDIMDLSGFKLVTGRLSFRFRFDINIKYFDQLDAAKWGAIKAGSEAFAAWVNANLELPDPTKFFVRKTIRN